jgi:glucan phosphoethanolaminetransferase (alkaline phosphatase superfamily)
MKDKTEKAKQYIAITFEIIPFSLLFIILTLLNSNGAKPSISSILLSALYFHIFLTFLFYSLILILGILKRRFISITNCTRESKMEPYKYIAIDLLIFFSLSFAGPMFATAVLKSENEIGQYIAEGIAIFLIFISMPAFFIIMYSLVCRAFINEAIRHTKTIIRNKNSSCSEDGIEQMAQILKDPTMSETIKKIQTEKECNQKDSK